MTAPQYALTDDALRIILHAEHTIGTPFLPRPAWGARSPRGGGLSASTRDIDWRRETAVLRLVSVVEAYVDAASTLRMSGLVTTTSPTVGQMLEDFAKDTSMTWSRRSDAYKRYHGFKLEACDRWKQLEAAIDLRNCLAHGLGTLTPHLRRKHRLSEALQPLEVTVTGNRMRVGTRTVPILAQVCREFVTSLDSKLTIHATRQ